MIGGILGDIVDYRGGDGELLSINSDHCCVRGLLSVHRTLPHPPESDLAVWFYSHRLLSDSRRLLSESLSPPG